MKNEVFEGQEPEPGETQQPTFADKFRSSLLDQAKDYPMPESIIDLVQNGDRIPLLTLKSYSLWQGKQKSKKTTLLALAIAAYISPRVANEEIQFECAIPGSVIFFDNEQGESYAARTMKLILRLAGLEQSDRFYYSDLRQYSPAERIKIIQAGIECTPDVKIVVIDGIVDLLTDFMDAAEGHKSITTIIRLCSEYDIHIAGVLHQNKADKNARAHVGSISSQKCEIEISTEVDTNDRAQSQVTCVNSRGLPFAPFAIRWDKGSLPAIVQEWTADKAKADRDTFKLQELASLATDIFLPGLNLGRSDAQRRIQNQLGVSEATGKRRMIDLIKTKLIYKAPDGKYSITTK